MSTEANPAGNSGDSGKPASATATAETLATDYLANELTKARAACHRTRLVGVILTLIVLAYMSFVTSQLTQYLQPKAAANMANVFISDQVTEKATELSTELKTRIPELISQLPGFLLQQLPEYRQALEHRIELDFRDYCHQTSREMGKHFDDYLDAHVVQIRAVLAATQDRELVKQLGPDLEKTILEYLKDKGADGESIKDKLDHSLEALKRIEAQSTRLALDKDLTPQEKKTRRVIAMISRAVADQPTDAVRTPAPVLKRPFAGQKEDPTVSEKPLPLPKKATDPKR